MIGRVAWLLAGALAFTSLARASDVDIELPQQHGAPLVLAAPATRIITLAPHLAELVFLSGAGNSLLATVSYSDHPAEAAELPRIGDAFRFDLERIMALQPDLVIAWDSGNPDAALDGLEALGLPVWRTEVRSIEDMAGLLQNIGVATGLDTREISESVMQRWQSLQASYDGRKPLRYFYQVAERPLYTVNGKHLISQGLGACGAENIFHDLPTLAPQIGPEAVLAANPEVLLAGRGEYSKAPLEHWLSWPQLSAVENDALIYLPADLINRATPRMLDAVAMACERLDEIRARVYP